jgi:phosphoglucosamine mutase
VLEHNADLGFALDGDGDRIMMVDHKGNVIDGDQILFIIARDALKAGRLQGGVVGTLMSNLGLEMAMSQLGIPFKRSNVGDRYVMELLQENNWQIGGEGSGHILNLGATSTGDGIVAGLQVITAMLRNDMSLHELASGMKKYPQTLVNVRYSENSVNYLQHDAVVDAVKTAEVTMGDSGRVLLRKSGTEPLIRVMVEAEDADVAQTMAQNIANVVAEVSK